MAEECVGKEQFGEFVKRMEDASTHANELADERYDSINRRLADAEKAREQNLVHVNQRFEQIDKRFGDMNQSMNQRFDSLERRFDDLRTMMVVMYTPIALAILGAVIKILFFSN